MSFRKNLFLLFVLLAGAGWGCKNNSSTSPNSAHPVDATVGQFGSGFDDLNSPMGLCVDGSDNLYVADYGNNRIKEYNSSGTTCLMTWSSAAASVSNVHDVIELPIGLALDGGGNVLEVDNGSVSIQQFSTGGTLLTNWGGAGTAAGKFNVPAWIAVSPGGSIYVSDTDNDRVQYFTAPGVVGGVLGASCVCTTLGDYETPTGIAFDSSGNAYVGDLGNHRIDVYNAAGIPVTFWGAGTFTNEDEMTFDHSGKNLLVVDDGAKAILKFNSSGNLIENWKPGFLARPKGIAVDSTGAIWVSFQDSGDAFLVKYAH